MFRESEIAPIAARMQNGVNRFVQVIKLYRESTFNDHVSVVFWRHLKLVAAISLQPVTGQRRIVLKTIVDPDVKPHHFDVEFRL